MRAGEQATEAGRYGVEAFAYINVPGQFALLQPFGQRREYPCNALVLVEDFAHAEGVNAGGAKVSKPTGRSNDR